MSKHALFSASASERWSNCPGSLAMSQGIPNGSSSSAREGTAGHDLGDRCLRTGADPLDSVGEFILVEGEEIQITDDLAEAVFDYVEYVRGFSGTMLSETRINYSELLGVDTEEGFGTSDAIVLCGTELHVFDLKLGRRYVEPKRNRQMMLYGAGVLKVLLDLGETVDKVALHIVQPRVVERPIPFEMTVDELNLEIDYLRSRAEVVKEAFFTYTGREDKHWHSLYLVPGEKQCEWCPAAAFCLALRNVAREYVDDDFDVVSLQQTVPGEEIAENLGMLPLLEIFAKATTGEANRRLTLGEKVPGYKLVKGREGNRRWRDVEAAEEVFADVDGDLIYAPRKLLTPPQMEKALKKNDAKSRIADLVVRNPARPTLAPESDPREPWSEAASADEFAVVE
jgi:hypothetical protein